MSLARFGDGELNLLRGKNCISQRFVQGIDVELAAVLSTPVQYLLVGVPRLLNGPKDHLWDKYIPKFTDRMNPKMQYGSAFISRPDSAPDIDTPEYFERVRRLWAGQRVTLVGNGTRSLTPGLLMETGAQHVDFVKSSYAHSYEGIDLLEQKAIAAPSRRVILVCGATATCLAARLTKKGHQAIDLGHIGNFWPKVTR